MQYFSNQLPQLYSLTGNREYIRQEWALKCCQTPCSVADFKFEENGNTDDRLTAKYPYYVWHKSKRLQPTQALTVFQDHEEDNMINLTCSEYLQEAVEVIEL